MKTEMIKVLKIAPGSAPETVTMPNTLEAFQAAVGGYIEALGLDSGACLICNEEGKLMGLPANRQVGDDIIAGTFLIVGEADDDFCSLSDEDAAYYAEQFARPMLSFGSLDEPTQWERAAESFTQLHGADDTPRGLHVKDVLPLLKDQGSIFLCHEEAEVSVLAENLQALTEAGREDYSALLNARVSEICPTPDGMEVVITDVAPEELMRFREAYDEFLEAEQAMGPAMQ